MADPNDGTNYQTLYTKGPQAIANNQTFLAVPAPTAAQTLAQVQALTRQVNALIRLQLALLDTTDGS